MYIEIISDGEMIVFFSFYSVSEFSKISTVNTECLVAFVLFFKE